MGLKNKGAVHDEKLAERVRKILSGPDVTERKMFGGLCFMVTGHMCCGIDEDDLFIRVDEETAEILLRSKYAMQFENGGRSMKGFIRIEASGLKDLRSVRSWLIPAEKVARARTPKPAS